MQSFKFKGAPLPSRVVFRYSPDSVSPCRLFLNHEIELVLPLASVPATSSGAFAYKVQLPIALLLEPSFIEKYIRQGELSAISYDAHIDRDNVVAILPNGFLCLSVDKETYHSLGLVGKRCQIRNRESTRLDITIDMRDPSFRPGQSLYKRVLWCVKDRTDPCTLLVCYSNSSGSNEIRFPDGAIVSKIDCPLTSHPFGDILVPTSLERWANNGFVSEFSTDENQRLSAVQDLVDWIGAINAKLITSINDAGKATPSNQFASTFSFGEMEFQSSPCSCSTRRLSGMISSNTVESWMNEAKSLVESKSVPWAAVSVFGFADSPISWRPVDSGKTWNRSQHDFEYGGENLYVVVILSDLSSIVVQVCGALDTI
uniref:Uncharacterized protein n=1 Tax=Spongospora subterranea TaxID=70186 RepID=A0A0H5RAF3_9EUKA|eukprot:CRZ11053.1 hypothetical protein [Spongospora subterranea]